MGLTCLLPVIEHTKTEKTYYTRNNLTAYTRIPHESFHRAGLNMNMDPISIDHVSFKLNRNKHKIFLVSLRLKIFCLCLSSTRLPWPEQYWHESIPSPSQFTSLIKLERKKHNFLSGSLHTKKIAFISIHRETNITNTIENIQFPSQYIEKKAVNQKRGKDLENEI